jgi:hypothetical protein
MVEVVRPGNTTQRMLFAGQLTMIIQIHPHILFNTYYSSTVALVKKVLRYKYIARLFCVHFTACLKCMGKNDSSSSN